MCSGVLLLTLICLKPSSVSIINFEQVIAGWTSSKSYKGIYYLLVCSGICRDSAPYGFHRAIYIQSRNNV